MRREKIENISGTNFVRVHTLRRIGVIQNIIGSWISLTPLGKEGTNPNNSKDILWYRSHETRMSNEEKIFCCRWGFDTSLPNCYMNRRKYILPTTQREERLRVHCIWSVHNRCVECEEKRGGGTLATTVKRLGFLLLFLVHNRSYSGNKPFRTSQLITGFVAYCLNCVKNKNRRHTKHAIIALGRNPDKSLKSFPPCYSQSPIQLCLEISIS